jgi:hypothetical protein
VRARRQGGEQLGRLRPEQDDDVHRRERGEVGRAAVVGDQDLGQAVQDEQLAEARPAGHRKTARGADAAD